MGVNVKWEKYFGDWIHYKEFNDFLNSRYMYSVLKYLNQEHNKRKIFPEKKDTFKAFKLCQPQKLKVVILGGDPYFDGSATGLAFANSPNKIKLNPSLIQIARSVEKYHSDSLLIDFDYTLESWADQGVLLLNTALSVQSNLSNSHAKVWKKFTEFVIGFIANTFNGTIFLLWGEDAKKYQVINGFDINSTCYILKDEHPGIISRNNKDWDCDHFEVVNKLIKTNNGREFCINW